MTNIPILSGVVGSTAYGLARAGSDIDRLGVYVAPSATFLGLRDLPERKLTNATHNPDVTLHELAKFLRLCLVGNPSVLELLWLPDDLYEVVTSLGQELLQLRSKLLNRDKIRSAYVGFAGQQLRELQHQQVPPHRRAKHARHTVRLLHQLTYLWCNANLVVRLAPWQIEECHQLGEQAAAGQLDLVEKRLIRTLATLDAETSALPKHADTELVEAWLLSVRHRRIREEPRVGVPALPD